MIEARDNEAFPLNRKIWTPKSGKRIYAHLGIAVAPEAHGFGLVASKVT